MHVTTKCIWLGSVIFYENYSISVKMDFIRQSTACSLKKHHVYFAFIFGNQFWGVFFQKEIHAWYSCKLTANTAGFSAIHRLSSIVFFGAKLFVKIILFPPNTCKTCFSAYFYFFSSKTLKMQCSALTFLDCLSLLYIIFCLF